jgi:hypothetical protein
MQWRGYWIAVVCVVCSIATHPALARDPSGITVDVIQSTEVVGEAGIRTLSIQEDVFMEIGSIPAISARRKSFSAMRLGWSWAATPP